MVREKENTKNIQVFVYFYNNTFRSFRILIQKSEKN